jgi:signal transduction histidine kinase
MKELAAALSAFSGIACLCIGLYVFLEGSYRLVKGLFLLITLFLFLWGFGDAMVATTSTVSAKVFWTKFQGWGELLLVPTYFLLSLYFPYPHPKLPEGRRRRLVVFLLCYAPFLLGLHQLYLGGLVYSGYFPAENTYGVDVQRTPYFWFLTALAFMMIVAASLRYGAEWRRSPSRHTRGGLLLLGLAPFPMLVANLLQVLKVNRFISTPQLGFLFAATIGYGIMRYGLFVDVRHVARRIALSTVALAVNLLAYVGLSGIYYHVLRIRNPVVLYPLIFLSSIPFMILYGMETAWIRRAYARLSGRRTEREGYLLAQLADSIRRLRGLEELAEEVTRTTRETMELSFCAVFAKREGSFLLLNHSAHPAHVTRPLEGMKGVLRLWRVPGGYAFSDGRGGVDGMVQVESSIFGGGVRLQFLGGGILRLYEGGGRTLENRWDSDDYGMAFILPLVAAGEEVGLLAVGNHVDGEKLAVEELNFLVSLSSQLAVSLSNSLHLQEVLEYGRRLRELVLGIGSAQERERARISRELHDGLVPQFLEIIFRVESMQGELEGPWQEELRGIAEQARNAVGELRAMISDLRPVPLEVLGLRRSLANYLERFGLESGMRTSFIWRDVPEGLDPLLETNIYRMVQEALANVARHSGADAVEISVVGGKGSITVSIHDNGRGMNPIPSTGGEEGHMGLSNIRERAELLGGSVRLSSRPGAGTRLVVELPVIPDAGGFLEGERSHSISGGG